MKIWYRVDYELFLSSEAVLSQCFYQPLYMMSKEEMSIADAVSRFIFAKYQITHILINSGPAIQQVDRDYKEEGI